MRVLVAIVTLAATVHAQQLTADKGLLPGFTGPVTNPG